MIVGSHHDVVFFDHLLDHIDGVVDSVVTARRPIFFGKLKNLARARFILGIPTTP